MWLTTVLGSRNRHSARVAPGRAQRGACHRNSRQRDSRRLFLESLEDRRLLAFVPAAIDPRGTGPEAVLTADFGSLRGHPNDYDSSRILVRFRPEASLNSLPTLAGTSISRELPLVAGLREVQLAPGIDVEKALAAYRNNPLVEYAQPNYRIHTQDTPNDPGFGSLWGLHNTGQTGGTPDADIDAAEAWDHWTGNGSTIVAVIDTGVDYTHPDLAGNMWTNSGENPGDGVDDDGNGIVDDYYGANFVYRDGSGNPTGDPYDDHYHGTHVAGTIGAIGDNSVGVAGVSWSVQIMAIKFLDAGGSGYTSDAIDGLNYAVSMGAMISNNSWGGGPYDQGLYDAIQSAGVLGHVFVAAAGNNGQNADFSPMYPAAYNLDNIVSVAATDHNDLLAGFSNYGATSVDLAAPGVSVYSTLPGNSYGHLSGTSMAAPHVAGVVALIRDLHPDWSAQQVKEQLLGAVDQIASVDGITVSSGRLNAAAAVTGTPPPDTTGPRISAQSPSGIIATPVSSLRVTFSESINPDTFDLADIGSFTGPGNVAIAATDVTPVPNSNGRQFDITFAEQSVEGVYSMIIGPEIQDVAATPNSMDQDRDGNQAEATDDQYTANFTIDYFPGPDGFGYEAHPIAIEAIDLVAGAPGVFSILDGVDDSYAEVNLGASTFTFYGVEYTGASLFVSSNGLITFGYGIGDYVNTDLSSWPDAPAIAPLWDDWVTFADEADEVLGKFEDEDGNGTADRLVIEWTVLHYGTYNSHVTFQALLGLNAGGLADPIIFNYPDLDTGDGDSEGQSATIGIKDNGAQGPNRLLVSANSTSPFAGTGQALRIAVEPQGPGLFISNASVNEGNNGGVEAVFRVTLVNPPADQTVTVNYATANGSATAPGDYTSLSGPLSFPPGTTSREVRVVVNGDRVDEANETFLVNLSNANGASIVDGQGGGSILDDDTAGITVSPASGLVTTESGASASLSVVLTSQPTENVTITLASSDTTEGTVSPATLVFTSANWNTAQLASVTGVNDAQVDGNISYVVSASAASTDPSYSGLVASASAVNQDNDFSVTYTSSNVPRSIPDPGKITSTLTAPSHTIRDVNVQLNITHGRPDDVEVYLSHPGGTKVELFTDVGTSGNNNNFTNTTLDDEASTAITTGRAPFNGSYRPEGSLAAFDNRNSLGTWTLEVGDDKKGQRGTLNQWSITIVYEQTTAGSSGQARAAKASSALAQSAATALPAVLVDRLFAAASRDLEPSRLGRLAAPVEEIADTRRERDDRSYQDLFGNSSHGLSTKDRSVGTSSSDGSTLKHQSSTEAIDAALEDLLSAGTRKRGR